jgi:hypothetical protein
VTDEATRLESGGLVTGALLVGGAEMVIARVHGDREGGAPQRRVGAAA